MSLVDLSKVADSAKDWRSKQPFPHFVVDDFFPEHIAKQLEAEFPEFDSPVWHTYGNAIEIKKACNNWNAFPPTTYRVLQYLNSSEFVGFMASTVLGDPALSADFGLNGGGWHIHGRGGKLNTHLDYSIHPKIGKQRKLNIIIYLNSQWQEDWGGQLGLWSNESSEKPGTLVKQVEPRFNRAAIFDTTCNSWHGLPSPLTCPEGQYRKSLAVYYLTEAPEGADPRSKALFAPSEGQENDPQVLELIKRRADPSTAASVYGAFPIKS